MGASRDNLETVARGGRNEGLTVKIKDVQVEPRNDSAESFDGRLLRGMKAERSPAFQLWKPSWSIVLLEASHFSTFGPEGEGGKGSIPWGVNVEIRSCSQFHLQAYNP